jgi:pyruvate kinase
MNVARLNFSHGTYGEHASYLKAIRKVAEELETPLAVIQDLPGPKLRTGSLKHDAINLKQGDEIVLVATNTLGDEHKISTNFPALPQDVKPRDIILLDDGAIRLEVVDVGSDKVKCRVAVGGRLTSRRGINVPGVNLSVPSVTDRDLEYLSFGIKEGVDFVALSFIREASDIRKVRQFLEQRGTHIPLIAKIEKHEAVDNVDTIISESDGVMVARGDLGVEISLESVPLVQKEIIQKCNRSGKLVIVATQMLESMINLPFPTRAEVSDIANAILDSADAVMLSAETATGKYPVEATSMMSRIALEVEMALPYGHMLGQRRESLLPQVDDAISYDACHTAEQLRASCIVAYTSSGSTAMRVSRCRPSVPVLAITPSDAVARRLMLSWGINPYPVAKFASVDKMFREAEKIALTSGMVKKGDLIVITAGIPLGIPGSTNLIKVQQVGEEGGSDALRC